MKPVTVAADFEQTEVAFATLIGDAARLGARGRGKVQVQNSVDHLDWVAWPGKFNFLKGRVQPALVRPWVRRIAVRMEGA